MRAVRPDIDSGPVTLSRDTMGDGVLRQSSASCLRLVLKRKNRSTSNHRIAMPHKKGSRTTLCTTSLSQLSIDLFQTLGDVFVLVSRLAPLACAWEPFSCLTSDARNAPPARHSCCNERPRLRARTCPVCRR